MAATRTRYSLRELIGTAVGLHKPSIRGQKNLLARRRSIYCSAFVQFVFQRDGIELVPVVHPSHSSPKDILQMPVALTTCLLHH